MCTVYGAYPGPSVCPMSELSSMLSSRVGYAPWLSLPLWSYMNAYMNAYITLHDLETTREATR